MGPFCKLKWVVCVNMENLCGVRDIVVLSNSILMHRSVEVVFVATTTALPNAAFNIDNLTEIDRVAFSFAL